MIKKLHSGSFLENFGHGDKIVNRVQWRIADRETVAQMPTIVARKLFHATFVHLSLHSFLRTTLAGRAQGPLVKLPGVRKIPV